MREAVRRCPPGLLICSLVHSGLKTTGERALLLERLESYEAALNKVRHGLNLSVF
jgi:hypothetical protein